ncbi:putative ribonuclease H-like domain-containing protein [Tanacetum coccineum]|uniref:Ribonuclease H-like domain-containing protein n=1 Tax=Tanacetum coccineum TaxID=301880 RepID=A0ABQ5HBX8_9ASTR
MKKMYCLVVTDDYSRFSWIFFLATKDKTSEILKTFITGIENLIDLKVKVIRCDNRTEFKNKVMNQFCEIKGIKREFSVARTPQQNGVAERKNRTLIEATRTMLAYLKLPTTFWAEATACRKPALSFMRPFGCPDTLPIADLDADAKVTLIDETQVRNDEDLMFDIGVLYGDEVFEEPIVNTAPTISSILVSVVDSVTTADEVVTAASVDVTTVSAPTTAIDELTMVQEPSEFTTTTSPSQASQLPQAKDKGKAKMVKPEKPLKKKDQIALDEELARRLEAQMQAELERERVAQEEANIAAIIEELDSIQAMIEADEQLAPRLQAKEQEQFSIEENYEEIQKLFDKAYNQVNSFVPMDSKVVKGSKTRTEESSKRARDELEYDKSKKQKIDEHVEAETDDDPKEAEMKKHMR